MTRQDDQAPGSKPEPRDKSDQLSPSHAHDESLGASESQRIGDNGPLANPVVSFPDEAGAPEPEGQDCG